MAAAGGAAGAAEGAGGAEGATASIRTDRLTPGGNSGNRQFTWPLTAHRRSLTDSTRTTGDGPFVDARSLRTATLRSGTSPTLVIWKP